MNEQDPVIRNAARAEAERRYPKRPFVVESHVQNSFIAGAEWQASRKVEVTDDMMERAEQFSRYQDEATGRWMQPIDDTRGLLSAALGGGEA